MEPGAIGQGNLPGDQVTAASDSMHNRYFPQSLIKPDPEKCHCGKVALYRVEKEGFCRDHKDEAWRRYAWLNWERHRP